MIRCHDEDYIIQDKADNTNNYVASDWSFEYYLNLTIESYKEYLT